MSDKIRNSVLVFIGGATGSACRYLISLLASSINFTTFPIATFVANMMGCFIIGILAGKTNLSKQLNLLLATGFCGGFTTFSAFSKETFIIIENGHTTLALLYISISILLGTFFVGVGCITIKKNK